MLFYALRIVCRNCGAASLLGGGAEYDLTAWREATVECRRCGMESSAADAQAVDLRSLMRDADTLDRLRPASSLMEWRVRPEPS